MKSLLIAYWKYILGFVLLVFIFSLIGISRCKEDRQTLVVEKANSAVLRAFLTDSINTARLELENVKLDSVKASDAKQTIKARTDAAYWKNIADKRGVTAAKYKNKADSLADAYTGTECLPFIKAYRQANDSLKSENLALDKENEKLDNEAQGYSRQLLSCETQSNNKDTINAGLKKYNKVLEKNIGIYQCYRDWGLKHRFWKWVFGWKCD